MLPPPPLVQCPHRRPLGVLQLRLDPLVAALAPPPEAALAALSRVLPQLAASAYSAFMGRVHGATARLNVPPASADELAAFLELLAQVVLVVALAVALAGSTDSSTNPAWHLRGRDT